VHHSSIASSRDGGKSSKEGGAATDDVKTHPRRSKPAENPTPPAKPYRARHDPHFSLEDKAERLKKKGIVLTGEVPKDGLLALNTLRPTVPKKQKKRVRKTASLIERLRLPAVQRGPRPRVGTAGLAFMLAGGSETLSSHHPTHVRSVGFGH
jgi:hypothetical protein